MTSTIIKQHHYKRLNKGKWRASILLQAAVIIMTLAGCAAVGPDYTKTEPRAPGEWHTELKGGLVTGSLEPEILANWWSTLNDAQLDSLMARAVKGNLNLKNAWARVREARALRGISRADLFPTLDASASASKYRISENIESSGKGTESKLYTVNFDAGWELDVFGGVRRSVEAAQAGLEATRENLYDVLVSLLAEVALNYVEVRTFQARLSVTEANITTQQKTYDLNRSRYEAGIIDELAVQQSLRVLETSRSQIPALNTRLEAAKNRLAVLLGEQPGKLHKELDGRKPIPELPATVVVGIPAETLRHRPDIRRAERDLAAQTALVGVAVADLYPKFHLFGTIGLEAISSGDLLEWSSRNWAYGPGISWNIFHGGAIRQNIEVQNARQEQALIQYEAAVLNAQEEVENILVSYAKEQLRRESFARAATAAQRAAVLAEDQYQAGLVDFNNVLDAQRSLLVLEDELSQSNGTVISNLIRLYKALGGGWESYETIENEARNGAKAKQ